MRVFKYAEGAMGKAFINVVILSICLGLEILTLSHNFAYLFMICFDGIGLWKIYENRYRFSWVAGVLHNCLSYFLAIILMSLTFYWGNNWTYYSTFAISLGGLYFIGRKYYWLLFLLWIPIGFICAYASVVLGQKFPFIAETELTQVHCLILSCVFFEFCSESAMKFIKPTKR
jgi:hypothetical protein